MSLISIGIYMNFNSKSTFSLIIIWKWINNSKEVDAVANKRRLWCEHTSNRNESIIAALLRRERCKHNSLRTRHNTSSRLSLQNVTQTARCKNNIISQYRCRDYRTKGKQPELYQFSIETSLEIREKNSFFIRFSLASHVQETPKPVAIRKKKNNGDFIYILEKKTLAKLFSRWLTGDVLAKCQTYYSPLINTLPFIAKFCWQYSNLQFLTIQSPL